jgi:hypothetical protein
MPTTSFHHRRKRLTPGINGARERWEIKNMLIARPLQAVVMPGLGNFNL